MGGHTNHCPLTAVLPDKSLPGEPSVAAHVTLPTQRSRPSLQMLHKTHRVAIQPAQGWLAMTTLLSTLYQVRKSQRNQTSCRVLPIDQPMSVWLALHAGSNCDHDKPRACGCGGPARDAGS